MAIAPTSGLLHALGNSAPASIKPAEAGGAASRSAGVASHRGAAGAQRTSLAPAPAGARAPGGTMQPRGSVLDILV